MYARKATSDATCIDPASIRPAPNHNTATLASVRALSEAIAALDAIEPEQVMSLATERRDRVYPGTLQFRPFLDPLPDSAQTLELVRSDVEAARQ